MKSQRSKIIIRTTGIGGGDAWMLETDPQLGKLFQNNTVFFVLLCFKGEFVLSLSDNN